MVKVLASQKDGPGFISMSGYNMNHPSDSKYIWVLQYARGRRDDEMIKPGNLAHTVFIQDVQGLLFALPENTEYSQPSFTLLGIYRLLSFCIMEVNLENSCAPHR